MTNKELARELAREVAEKLGHSVEGWVNPTSVRVIEKAITSAVEARDKELVESYRAPAEVRAEELTAAIWDRPSIETRAELKDELVRHFAANALAVEAARAEERERVARLVLGYEATFRYAENHLPSCAWHVEMETGAGGVFEVFGTTFEEALSKAEQLVRARGKETE